MLDVEGQKPNSLQAEVLRYSIWTGPKMRLLSYKLAATSCGVFLSPHSICEVKHMEEHRLCIDGNLEVVQSC